MEKLFKSIYDSFEILNFEDDWDEDGAKKVSRVNFINALIFLLTVIKEVGENLTPLHLTACSDGSVDLVIDHGFREKVGFLMNFSEERVGGYGINYKTKDEIKFETSPEMILPNENLIDWIKMNLVA